MFNLLWLLSFYGLVAMDVTDDPHSKLDVLRGFAPIETFGLLIMFGRNGLLRRHTLLSILVCWRTQRLIRFKEMLLHEVQKGDPFYHVAGVSRGPAVCGTGGVHAGWRLALAIGTTLCGWSFADCGTPARLRYSVPDVEVFEGSEPDCRRVASVRD